MNTQAPLHDRGVIHRYRAHLPVTDATPVISLNEGSTPLIHSPRLSERTGAEVYIKFEGLNPTGSFKDRGMTVAISKAIERGAQTVICASTGNTSAAAAAYAARAGIKCAVILPAQVDDQLTFDEMVAFCKDAGLMTQKIPERLEIRDERKDTRDRRGEKDRKHEKNRRHEM